MEGATGWALCACPPASQAVFPCFIRIKEERKWPGRCHGWCGAMVTTGVCLLQGKGQFPVGKALELYLCLD